MSDKLPILSARALSHPLKDSAHESNPYLYQNINLDIMPGELITICGDSGIGKTTLLHQLAGLTTIEEGTVHLGNTNIGTSSINTMSEIRSKRIAVIYQQNTLLPDFTVAENIQLPMMIAKAPAHYRQQQSTDLLECMNLSHLTNRYPSSLSGGEQARIGILRALSTQPDIIFADEPTGNLDPNNSIKCLEIIKKAQKMYHTTVVIVTHDMKIAKQADTCYWLKNKTLIRADTHVKTSVAAEFG